MRARAPRWRVVLWLGIATVVLGLALGGSRTAAHGQRGTSAAPTIDAPVSTTGCGVQPAIAPGTTGVATLTVDPAADEGSATRTYRVHVPAGYNAQQPIPLVLAFHGYTGTATGMEATVSQVLVAMVYR